MVPAISLDEAGPFAELGEAGLQVGLEGEEGREGVVLGIGEWFGGKRLCRGHRASLDSGLLLSRDVFFKSRRSMSMSSHQPGNFQRYPRR